MNNPTLKCEVPMKKKQKHYLCIAYKDDPKLNLGYLNGLEIDKFYFNISEIKSDNSNNKFTKITNKFFWNGNGISLEEKLHLNVYKKAELKKANIAIIEEQTKNSIKGTFYSSPKIKFFHTDRLFEEGICTNYTSNKYSLVKSHEYFELTTKE